MWWRGQGITRRDLRQGSGTDVEVEHYDEVLGSSEFYIYVAPNKRPKGYEALKKQLEAEGCDVVFPAESPLLPGKRYQAVKVTCKGEVIPDSSMLRAHRWAHRLNFLHHFFRPLLHPPKPSP